MRRSVGLETDVGSGGGTSDEGGLTRWGALRVPAIGRGSLPPSVGDRARRCVEIAHPPMSLVFMGVKSSSSSELGKRSKGGALWELVIIITELQYVVLYVNYLIM